MSTGTMDSTGDIPQPQAAPQSPTRPPAPPPAAPHRTLSAMWGSSGSTNAPSNSAPASNSAPSSLPTAGSAAGAPRKRRKNDAGAGQARLTLGAGGVGVAAPLEKEPENPKPEKKTKVKAAAAAAGSGTEHKSRQKRKSDENTGTTMPVDDEVIVIDDTPAPVRKRKAEAQVGGARASTGSSTSPGASFSVLSSRSSPAPQRLHPSINTDGDVVFAGARGARGSRGASGSRASSPITIDGEEKPPLTPVPGKRVARKIGFAADAGKPPHSFFAKHAPATAVAVSATPAGTHASSSGPAVVSSAPHTGASTSTKASTSAPTRTGTATPAASVTASASRVHSFFSLAAASAQGVLRTGWGCCREGEEPLAPWPGEWRRKTVHSNGVLGSPAETSTTGLVSYGVPARPPRPRSGSLSFSVPPFILQHPAITALAATVPNDTREMWCDAHRPRTTSAVLGNEVEATYLRDWLLALSVGSREARRIVRRMPRQRKAADPDRDWIVDDLGPEPFTDDIDDGGDGFERPPDFEEEPEFHLGGRPEQYAPIELFIGNTLLLTGPSGCGKTAAVYAAAAELGWDVFEVYPGIGKRTGANLLALVGEVGKNHMVGGGNGGERKDRDREKKREAAKAFFGAEKSSQTPSGSGSEGDPIALVDTPKKAPLQMPARPKPPQDMGTKQSLILLDEADILFEEESTFWPAVVSLIAESHRPVVITCNDLSRIPRRSLPIHQTLYFEPPPGYLAQPYLAALACARGVPVDTAQLFDQCSAPPVDLVDQPLPPGGNEPARRFDMRAAITQLQLSRGRGDGDERVETDRAESMEGMELAEMVHALDAVSLADAHLAPRAWERMEVAEIDSLAPGPDDEDGLRQLLKADDQHRHPVLAQTSHAAEIASTLASLAGAHLPLSIGLDARATRLQLQQTAYIRRLLPALDEVVYLSDRLLPHPTLFTEKAPYLRALVRADDLLEEADRAARAAGVARVNRHTGRAVRGSARGYERHIAMGPAALEAAREEVLVWRD